MADMPIHPANQARLHFVDKRRVGILDNDRLTETLGDVAIEILLDPLGLAAWNDMYDIMKLMCFQAQEMMRLLDLVANMC